VPKDPPKLPPNYFDVPPKLRAWYKSLGEVPPGFKQFGVDLRRFVQMTGQLPSRLREMKDFIKRETRELKAEEAKLKARREQLEHQCAMFDQELGAPKPMPPVEQVPVTKPKLSLVKQTPSPEQVPPQTRQIWEPPQIWDGPAERVIGEAMPKIYPGGKPSDLRPAKLKHDIENLQKQEAKAKGEKSPDPPSWDACKDFLLKYPSYGA
jgi:hypothetical protein